MRLPSLLSDEEIEACILRNMGDTHNAVRAIETAILAKLGSAELPEPDNYGYHTHDSRGNPGWLEQWLYSEEQITAWGNTRYAQGFAVGAASQLAELPTCWITPDGEGFRMRLTKPVTDVPLGWDALYTRREA